jgi:hypothetical protein
LGQIEAEGDTRTDLAQRLAVDPAAAPADIEGDVVAHLPDRTDRGRAGLRSTKVVLGGDDRRTLERRLAADVAG